MTLVDLQVGQEATIEHVDSNSDQFCRYFESGFVPGATIKMQQKTPFGGPVVVAVGNAQYALITKDAQSIGIMKR